MMACYNFKSMFKDKTIFEYLKSIDAYGFIKLHTNILYQDKT